MNSSVEGNSGVGAREKRGKERVGSRNRNLKGTRLFFVIDHHILSLARGWPRRITWPNIPSFTWAIFEGITHVISRALSGCYKWGKNLFFIKSYHRTLKRKRPLQNNWRIINTIASIPHENTVVYFCLWTFSVSQKWVFLDLRSRKSDHILQHIMSTEGSPLILEVMDSCRGQISVHHHSVRNQYQANFLAFH